MIPGALVEGPEVLGPGDLARVVASVHAGALDGLESLAATTADRLAPRA